MATQENQTETSVSNANTNAGLTAVPNEVAAIQPFLNYVQQNYLTQSGSTPTVDSNFVQTATVTPTTTTSTATSATTPTTTVTSDMTSAEKATASMQDVVNLGTSPEPTNLVSLYNQLRTERGVADLESSVTALQSAENDVAARLRERTNIERGKAVPLNVMSGRIGEIETQEKENLDYIDRQLTTKTLQLQTANNIISNIISLTSQDYSNASTWFNNEFSKRMQVHSAYETEADHDQQVAQSEAEIVINMLQNGTMSYDSLTPEQKITYGKMEVAAGFEPGFLASIKMTPGANVITTSSRTGSDGYNYVDIVSRQADGSIKVENVKTGKAAVTSSSSGSSSSSTATAEYSASDLVKARNIFKQADIQDYTDNVEGSSGKADGILSENEVAWVQNELSGTFDPQTAAALYDKINSEGYYHT